MTPRNELDLEQNINLIKEKELDVCNDMLSLGNSKKAGESDNKDKGRCEKYCNVCMDLFLLGTL